MVPSRNIVRRHFDNYDGSCYDHTQLDYHQYRSSITTGYMAEEDIRTGGASGAGGDGSGGGGNGDDEGEEGDVGTSDSTRCGGRSGEGSGGDEGWLQLGIGTTSPAISKSDGHQPAALLELNLFSDRPLGSRTRPSTSMGPSIMSGASTAASGLVPLFPTSYRGYPREVTWGMWNAAGAASSSMPLLPPLPYGPRQLMYMSGSGNLGFPAVEGGRNPVDVRVVSPPSRPQNGLWFFLQASQNQSNEPFLPQIPKSYLRIKDGRMTIRLLMKYLVNKLGLDIESEVEITCRGQQLPPHLTLQHVRDHIWCPRDVVSALPDSTINHVMTLQYGRSTPISYN